MAFGINGIGNNTELQRMQMFRNPSIMQQQMQRPMQQPMQQSSINSSNPYAMLGMAIGNGMDKGSDGNYGTVKDDNGNEFNVALNKPTNFKGSDKAYWNSLDETQQQQLKDAAMKGTPIQKSNNGFLGGLIGNGINKRSDGYYGYATDDKGNKYDINLNRPSDFKGSDKEYWNSLSSEQQNQLRQNALDPKLNQQQQNNIIQNSKNNQLQQNMQQQQNNAMIANSANTFTDRANAQNQANYNMAEQARVNQQNQFYQLGQGFGNMNNNSMNLGNMNNGNNNFAQMYALMQLMKNGGAM